jgi:hypothetical protein
MPVKPLRGMPPVVVEGWRLFLKTAARFVPNVHVELSHADVMLGESFAQRWQIFQ